jgi:hypothetical protein
MPRVYFDTTVYDAIAKDEVPFQDLDALRPMIARRKIVAYPSIVDVEELLGQWETEPAEAVRRLQIMGGLVGFSPMLKQPVDLLDDAIRAYAAKIAPPSPTLRPRDDATVAEHLRRIVRGDRSLDPKITEVVAHVKKRKQEAHTMFAEARSQSHAQLNWDQLAPQDRKAFRFEDYFASNARPWAESFAKPLGQEVLGACQRRGLDGLTEVRPVRICVGAVLSLIFAQIVGDGVQSRKARRGDGDDLWHALSASVADVFVTGDRALTQQLQRVPVKDFRVVSSIRELLDDPALTRSR